MTINEQILLFFNGYHTPFLDVMMTSYTSSWLWAPFYAACFGALVYKFGWVRALFYLAVSGAAIGAADYICASVLRPLFHQMRPSNPDNPFSQYVTLVNGYRGGPNGFPSCHAANSFALTSALVVFTRSWRLAAIMTAWAVFICITRMYVGVHYPTDLLAGAAVGSAIGTSMALAGRSMGRHIQACRSSRGFKMLSFSFANPMGQSTVSLSLGPIFLPFAVLLVTLMTVALASI